MNPVIAQAVQTVAIPTAWFWPSVFGLVVAALWYFLKGKFDRWDATSSRVHEHATVLSTHTIRIEHLERQSHEHPHHQSE